MLHGFDYTEFREKAFQLLVPAADHIIKQEDGKQRFADHVLAATKAIALCGGMDEALPYRDELAFFQAIRAAIAKSTGADRRLSDEQKEHALRQIMSNAVVSDEVVEIFEAAGLNKPDISILSDEYLEDVRQMMVSDSYSGESLDAVAVYGDDFVGGLVGLNAGPVERSYSVKSAVLSATTWARS